jgi:hypothetical protein
VTFPYPSLDRVLRGAIPEYLSICLLPLVLYLQLRAISGKNPWAFIGAILSTSAVFQLHLVTGFFFEFFFGLFLVFTLIYNLPFFHKKENSNFRKFPKRLACFLFIGLISALLSAFYLGPLAFYPDLMIKGKELELSPISLSASTSNIISLISLVDTPFPNPYPENHLRVQMGVPILAALVASVFFLWNRKSSPFLRPLILSAFTILVFVTFAGPLSGFLKFLNFAQFSYRFLIQFSLLSTILGALSFSELKRQYPELGPPGRLIIVFSFSLFSLILVSPYLYPHSFKRLHVDLVYSENIPKMEILPRANNSFLRIPPDQIELSKLPSWDPTLVVSPTTSENSKSHTFQVDLETMRSGPEGSLILDVLYYPGLQDISVTVDGKKIYPIISTYWALRDNLDYWGLNPGPFHAPIISGLPKKGRLIVKTNFKGYPAANFVSLVALLLLAPLAFFRQRVLIGKTKGNHGPNVIKMPQAP